MSLITERRIARIRPRGSKLFLPSFFLFVSCFAVSFFTGRLTEQWHYMVLWVACGLVAFFFWLVPLLSFISTFLDVTTTRVMYRSGLLGKNRREVKLTHIKDVHLSRGRSITIIIDSQNPMVLHGIPKHKVVAAEIDRLAASSSFVR